MVDNVLIFFNHVLFYHAYVYIYYIHTRIYHICIYAYTTCRRFPHGPGEFRELPEAGSVTRIPFKHLNGLSINVLISTVFCRQASESSKIGFERFSWALKDFVSSCELVRIMSIYPIPSNRTIRT